MKILLIFELGGSKMETATTLLNGEAGSAKDIAEAVSKLGDESAEAWIKQRSLRRQGGCSSVRGALG